MTMKGGVGFIRAWGTAGSENLSRDEVCVWCFVPCGSFHGVSVVHLFNERCSVNLIDIQSQTHDL